MQIGPLISFSLSLTHGFQIIEVRLQWKAIQCCKGYSESHNKAKSSHSLKQKAKSFGKFHEDFKGPFHRYSLS